MLLSSTRAPEREREKHNKSTIGVHGGGARMHMNTCVDPVNTKIRLQQRTHHKTRWMCVLNGCKTFKC